MKILVKAIVTGFGLSVGSMIFKKVAKRFGLDEPSREPDLNARDGATDPALQHS